MTTTELSAEHKEAWITFVVAHAVLTKQIDKQLEAKGLPGLDVYSVLLTLEDSDDGRLRMSELADQIMLSRSGITRLVDRLERDGLLKRHACPADRRAMYAAITQKGLAMRKRMWPIYRDCVLELFAEKMNSGEAETLSRVFQRILEEHPRELLHGMPSRECGES